MVYQEDLAVAEQDTTYRHLQQEVELVVKEMMVALAPVVVVVLILQVVAVDQVPQGLQQYSLQILLVRVVQVQT